MTPAIRTVRLGKRSGATEILDGVDLQVARGECLGLAAANGLARSTLLRILATLISPSAGTIEVCGVDAVRRLFEVRSRLAYVGEGAAEGFGLRTREYLEFVRRSRTRRTPQVSACEALDRAEVPPNAAVDGLSRDLRRRLAVAAAMTVGPDVLLVDISFCSFPRTVRAAFVEWLREIRDCGTTIVASLLDDDEVEGLCQRVVRLESGRLVAALAAGGV